MTEEHQPDGEGQQDSYLPPDVPPGYVNPPSGTQFANATWLRAGPEIRTLVEGVLDYDEFRDLRDLDYSVVWRRNGTPMLPNDVPAFATVDIVPARVIWEALQLEERNFPRFIVDLRWTHFDALRRGKSPGEPEGDENQPPGGRGAEYVHHGVLEQHVHHALMSIYVDNDIIHRRPVDFFGYADTVRRFGSWNAGIAAVRTQLSLFDQKTSQERPLHIQAAD